jgi:pyruvate/2-oxoglutarate dehydrogenase complex dihydrolipoamide acyltransferase (E2) component
MKLLKEIIVPQESVNDLFVTLMSVFVKNGSKVSAGDQLFELESSKATTVISAELDGYFELLFQIGDEIKIAETIARIYDAPLEIKSPVVEVPSEKPGNIIHPVKTLFSDKALQLMAVYKLSETDFLGFDFVNEDDVKLKAGIKTPLGKNERKIATEPLQVSVPHHNEKIKIAKKREIEYLRDVQSAGLNSQVTCLVDISNIFIALNKQFKYFKNSILPIVIYETARLLKKYPELNSFFNNGEICFYDEINIGVALDIDDGLKTIKIANSDTKNVFLIEDELMNLSEKYLSKTLTSAELTGITFTISDLSSEHVLFFTPLINRQNSAILGISSVQENTKCCFTLSFDHRLSVGKDVSRFLQELKTRIESYRPFATIDTSKISCYKCFKTLDEDFSDVGFVKVLNKKGEESYLCQTCMKGF